MSRSLALLRSSDTGLRFVAYLVWHYLGFALFLVAGMNYTVSAAGLPLLSALLSMCLVNVFSPFARGPSPCDGVARHLHLLIPAYLFAWPPEKMFSLLLHKFTCFCMGMNYSRLGRHKKAIAELEKVATDTLDAGRKAMLRVALADSYVKTGEYDKAIGNLHEAILLQPHSDALRNDLEQCHAMKHDFERAARACAEEMLTPLPCRDATQSRIRPTAQEGADTAGYGTLPIVTASVMTGALVVLVWQYMTAAQVVEKKVPTAQSPHKKKAAGHL